MKIGDQARNTIKSFELKKYNRSILQNIFLDAMAEKVLTIVPYSLSPTRLSILSLLFTFIGFMQSQYFGPSRIAFILQALLLFLYQLTDNLVLKQALKGNGINFHTVFVDHISDSISCSLIALTMGNLLGFSASSKWLILLFFSLLPYYMQHIRVYYSDRLEFSKVNPVDEGLVALQFICLASALIGPGVWSLQTIFFNFTLRSLFLVVMFGLLVFYLYISVRNVISDSANPHDMSIKNLIVPTISLQVFIEVAVLTTIVQDQNTFRLISLAFILTSTVGIGRILVAYGAMERFNQISLDYLLLTLATIVYCSIQFLTPFSNEEKMNTGFTIVLFVGSLLYFLYWVRQTHMMLVSLLSS